MYYRVSRKQWMSERDEIQRIVAEILELPLAELDDGASFTEVYFADSLERYRIMLMPEIFFDLHFPPEALNKIQSVESAERAIRALPTGRRGERDLNFETIETLEGKIGYTFRNHPLLVLALTHTSFANEAHSGHLGPNEKLEFLGDTVLELVSSDFFYREKPKLSEGEFTKLRASFVCEPTLAYCAKQVPLPPYLLLGRGEEMTGGRLRPSIVSDAMEVVIGAIYLDGGLTPTRTYIDCFILDDIGGRHYFYDAKTIFQEEIQKNKNVVFSYELRGEEGPRHLKRSTVAALRDGVPLAEGEDSSKEEAGQRTAYAAFLVLGITRGGTCT